MNRWLQVFTVSNAFLLAAWTRGAGTDDPRSKAAEHLANARQFGWRAAAPLMDNLGQSDAKKFPGLQAFYKDYRKVGKDVRPDRPPDQWPPIDTDALLTRNPNFWRAGFEIRPGDPAWLYTQAGLLLSAGEAARAQQVLVLARQSRGLPREVRKAVEQMLRVAEQVIRDANEAVASGIELYDRGDKPGAMKRYRDALTIWPQNAFAHYELGLTLRARAMEARGEPVPKLGTIQVNEKLPETPEVEDHFARSRQHDPLRWQAYQGSGPDVLSRLMALQPCLKAWEAIASSGDRRVTDDLLAQFAEGCQQAGIHDLALVAKQLVVARRGHLSRDDHAFISMSLRKLVPGPQAEATLRFLDNPRIEMLALSDPEPED
jgi:tetratricopeptide (TPR) repeat protein